MPVGLASFNPSPSCRSPAQQVSSPSWPWPGSRGALKGLPAEVRIRVAEWPGLALQAGVAMSKREEQRIAALIKKNAAKVSGPRPDKAAQYDDTLRKKAPETDDETKRFFKEMKRREF